VWRAIETFCTQFVVRSSSKLKWNERRKVRRDREVVRLIGFTPDLQDSSISMHRGTVERKTYINPNFLTNTQQLVTNNQEGKESPDIV